MPNVPLFVMLFTLLAQQRSAVDAQQQQPLHVVGDFIKPSSFYITLNDTFAVSVIGLPLQIQQLGICVAVDPGPRRQCSKITGTFSFALTQAGQHTISLEMQNGPASGFSIGQTRAIVVFGLIHNTIMTQAFIAAMWGTTILFAVGVFTGIPAIMLPIPRKPKRGKTIDLPPPSSARVKTVSKRIMLAVNALRMQGREAEIPPELQLLVNRN